MFTLTQIAIAHNKVKSGSDFPAYIKDLKNMGVVSYITSVKDGHTTFSGEEGFIVKSESKYPRKEIAQRVNATKFQTDLKAHQQGKTDFPRFCDDCAVSGVAYWKMDLIGGRCTYFNLMNDVLLQEFLPS